MNKIENIIFGKKFFFIAGPCVIENKKIIFQTAEKIASISQKYNVPFVFKSSYKKANRTSVKSFVGIEFKEAKKILEDVKKTFSLPILTDVHTENEIDLVCDVADILQIPAFLSRQTDLLIAAGKTNKIVNIKKGQFLSPYDIKFSAEKIVSTGNKKILLTERGTTFGYNNLVVDMRSLEIMKQFGYPIIYDATHSVQLPSANSGISGGQKEFILPLAKSATAIGINGIFLETHPNPNKAKSDSQSQLPLNDLENFVSQILEINTAVKKYSK